jgi:hypothetical protein
MSDTTLIEKTFVFPGNSIDVFLLLIPTITTISTPQAVNVRLGLEIETDLIHVRIFLSL